MAIFSPQELPLSINTKETLAIWYSYMSFKHHLKNKHVLLLSDNTMAISYIRSMGGMSSKLRTKIVRDLWNTAVENNTWFTITHIPGILNTESDIASRFLNDRTEWEISSSLFNKIKLHHAVTPSVNLFASRLNKKLPNYCSFGSDPFCSYVDAFTFSWDKFPCSYIYAPFNLLSRVMAKLKQDKATALVICPAWPNQPWFPMMLSMLVQLPCLLPNTESVLTLPWNLNIVHPNSNNLRLLSVMLSGIHVCAKAFRRKLPGTLFTDIDSQPKRECPPQPKDGTYFVSHGKYIQCTRLSMP